MKYYETTEKITIHRKDKKETCNKKRDIR